MNELLKFPFYIKASILLIGFFVFISILSIGQDILLPFIYAIIIAVLLSPMVNFLVKRRLNRALSIAVVLLTTILMVIVFIALISSQATRLVEAWPHLANKFKEMLAQTVAWVSAYFNISTYQINEWIRNVKGELLSNAFIGNTLTSIGGILAGAFLTPAYIFMILFYQPHLVEFTHKLFGVSNDNKVSELFAETKAIIQSYLVGLFIEFGIVAALNSIGLLILGIEYAILLGIAGALLNVIPYIGGIIGVALFVVIALVTKSPVYVVYVIGLYSLIQFIDNHYIVPKVVGSKVKLNALVCILAVVAGAALWGIPGMFLSIPLTAIIKLILDRTESLKLWGFLMGETVTAAGKIKFTFPVKGFIQEITSRKKINKK